jgi:hypothetical protein
MSFGSKPIREAEKLASEPADPFLPLVTVYKDREGAQTFVVSEAPQQQRLARNVLPVVAACELRHRRLTPAETHYVATGHS